MAKIERWKPNKSVDPNYPYYCYRNEEGTIIYSVPLEAPNDIPEDESEGAEKREYSYLPLIGGMNLRVYCWETSDKEWAYRIRSWINTAHTQEYRYSKRYTLTPEVLGDGQNDGNRKVTHPSGEFSDDPTGNERETGEGDHGKCNGYEQHGWPDIEKQMMDREEIQAVKDLVISKNPRWWQIFYRMEFQGEEAKEIAAEMGISVQRVHQLCDKVKEIARKYRKENP